MVKPDSPVPSAPSATLEALRASIGVLRWALFILVAIYLVSNVRVIGPNSDALVLRLGRLMDRVHPPGLLVAFPRPIDEVIVVPTRTVQEIEVNDWAPAGPPPAAAQGQDAATPASEASPPLKPTLHPVNDGYALTGDVNLVHMRFSARYSVSDPRDYARRVRSDAEREGLLRKILLDAATEATQSMGVDDALTSGQERLRNECRRIAQGKIDRLKLGILLQAWELREIIPARQVLAAFEEVVSAKVEASTLIEKSNAYRQSRMPEIDAKVFRTRQVAESEGRRLVERAQGEATSFVTQWEVARHNIDAFRAQRHIETVERVLRRAWLPAVSAGQGPPLQLLIRPPAHDPEPITDE